MKCTGCLNEVGYPYLCPPMSEADKLIALAMGDRLCTAHRMVKEVQEAKAKWYGERAGGKA